MIIHFSTVHPRKDTRIYVKEVATLAKAFKGQVKLYVQDGLGDEIDPKTGIETVDTGMRPAGRIKRMIFGSWRMYRALLKAKPSIVHFHDPELIPIGVLLKLSGIKVVYDVHEDVPGQISSKPYIPKLIRTPLAFCVRMAESIATMAFDGVVVATPPIARNFSSKKCLVVHNFPILGELNVSTPIAYQDRPKHFAYVGGITKIRCAYEMVGAFDDMKDDDIRLQLAGRFQPKELEQDIQSLAGWRNTDFLGWASREQVADMLDAVRAGFIILHPVQNYIESFPNKMFEYMATGLPVIASDFPYWREMLKDVDCALFVDAFDKQAVINAMQWILDNPKRAEEMGLAGQVAIEKNFNWENEAKNLVAFYTDKLGAKVN